MSLYRKYRPQTFSEVFGQTNIVQTLSNAIIHGRIGHAYLFTGPRGTGKTTLARIFARAVNCQNRKDKKASEQDVVTADPCLECLSCKTINEGKSLDIFEIDAASNTGVDNIRELRETVKLPPTMGKFKVYIIDEVHMLSTGAFNALLKTLEEPPSHVIFILATTEIHKVPETIISRCQRYDFARISLENIVTKLSRISEREKVTIEKDALEMIAIAAEGGMRDAESLLSQIFTLEDKTITAKEVEDMLGTSRWESLFEIADKILRSDASGAIRTINQLANDGSDLDVLHKSFLNFLRQLLLVSVDKSLVQTFSYELTSEQSDQILKLAEGRQAKDILHIVNCFAEIQGKVKSSFIPQLPLELAIVKAVGSPEEEASAPTLPTTSQKPTRAPQTPPSSQPARIADPNPTDNTPAPGQADTPSSTEDIKPATDLPDAAEQSAESKKAQTTEPKTAKQGAFSLYDVKRNWHAISDEVKSQNHSLATLFPVCQPIEVDGSTIVIAAKYGFHRDKFKDNANLLTIEAAFAKILGFEVRLKAVTYSEAGIQPAESVHLPSSGPGEQKKKETSSLLSDAMGIMGGQIVE